MGDVEIVYKYVASPDADRRPFPADPEAARARLEGGNEAFADLLAALETSEAPPRRLVIPLDPRDVGLTLPHAAAAPLQRPYAAVLGCSDARVPTELLFGEGPNDLFVVRLAGNVLGHEVLGSLRYAALHLPLRCVVVLGHSGCGAVSAAVDLFLDPRGILALAADHEQRGLLNHLAMIVQAAARVMLIVHGEEAATKPGWRAALVEMTVALNAALAANAIAHDLAALADRREPIMSLHGVYDITSRRMLAADPELGERPGLATVPRSHSEFVAHFSGLALASRLRSVLDATYDR